MRRNPNTRVATYLLETPVDEIHTDSHDLDDMFRDAVNLLG